MAGIRCINCRRGFRPERGTRGRYCSDICRRAAKTRRERNRRADKKADEAPGTQEPTLSPEAEDAYYELTEIDRLVEEHPYGVASGGKEDLFRDGHWQFATKLTDVFEWYSNDGPKEGRSTYWDDIPDRALAAPRDYVFRDGDPRVRKLRKLDKEGRPKDKNMPPFEYEYAIPSDNDIAAEWFRQFPRWWDSTIEYNNDLQQRGRTVKGRRAAESEAA